MSLPKLNPPTSFYICSVIVRKLEAAMHGDPIGGTKKESLKLQMHADTVGETKKVVGTIGQGDTNYPRKKRTRIYRVSFQR